MTTQIQPSHEITLYRLLSLRGAVKLETKGLRHSSGRSMTAQARRELKLKRNTPHETVIEELTKKIEEILAIEGALKQQTDKKNFN